MEKEEAIPEAGTLRTEDGAETAGNHGEGEGKGGGIMDHLISNLVFSPSSSEAGRIDELKAEDSEERNMGEVGGELFANMISNIHNEEQKEEEMAKDFVEEDEKLKQKENNRGGIINNIVNSLPTSLTDDAAPTTDEAAILIHSIIHE